MLETFLLLTLLFYTVITSGVLAARAWLRLRPRSENAERLPAYGEHAVWATPDPFLSPDSEPTSLHGLRHLCADVADPSLFPVTLDCEGGFVDAADPDRPPGLSSPAD